MDAGEITERVLKKFKDEGDLHDRMDEDFKLWNLEKTAYKTGTDFVKDTIKGTKESEVNIISNDARTSGDRVQATLSAAEMQIAVRMAEAEGEDKREDIGKLERLFYFALAKGDERLRRLLLLPLRESLIWFSLYRGWAAGRFLVYKSGKDIVFDFLSLDRRWLSYEVGANGFIWVGSQTFRSKAALKDEYDYEAKKDNDNCVIDYWECAQNGDIYNSTICDNNFLRPFQPMRDILGYDLPSMPILIMPVATRPLIASTSEEKAEATGYGESIFAPIRGINETRNKFASIVATHANLLAKQPVINMYDEEGKQLQSTVYLAEAVLNLPMGHNKLEPAPMKEISPTVVQIMGWLNDQIERGILPNIPLTQPPPSGTLYNLIQEAGNKIYNPQLKNLSCFYADICRLIEEQLLAGKLNVKVQQQQKRKYYETQVKPVDLKKPHIIEVEFTAKTPWTQMDTAQVALMLEDLGLPKVWIWENILKVQDPKLLQDLLALEVYEHSPEGMRKRAVEVLMDRGYVFEAQKLIEEMVRMERQEAVPAEASQPRRPPEMPPEMPPEGGLGI